MILALLEVSGDVECCPNRLETTSQQTEQYIQIYQVILRYPKLCVCFTKLYKMNMHSEG